MFPPPSLIRLGKTCNHVAAVLFKLDHAWKYGLIDPACTSIASSWIGTSKTILPQRVQDVAWERYHYSKGKVKFIPSYSNSFTLLCV